MAKTRIGLLGTPIGTMIRIACPAVRGGCRCTAPAEENSVRPPLTHSRTIDPTGDEWLAHRHPKSRAMVDPLVAWSKSRSGQSRKPDDLPRPRRPQESAPDTRARPSARRCPQRQASPEICARPPGEGGSILPEMLDLLTAGADMAGGALQYRRRFFEVVGHAFPIIREFAP